MNNQDWSLLTKLPDLISRGALINRLGEEQIEVYAPERDVIVNLNANTPNLSLEGYSALFDGYEIYVLPRQLNDAKKIWEEFQQEMYKPSETNEIDHPHKFYFLAVMSLFLPVVTHILAFYHLREGLKKEQKFSLFRVVCALFVMIPTLFLGWFYLDQIWVQIIEMTHRFT